MSAGKSAKICEICAAVVAKTTLCPQGKNETKFIFRSRQEPERKKIFDFLKFKFELMIVPT